MAFAQLDYRGRLRQIQVDGWFRVATRGSHRQFIPRYPVITAALLDRLVVGLYHQGKALGATLLADALIRAARAKAGVFAMLVEVKNDAGKRFYERFGFTLLPGELGRLSLPTGYGATLMTLIVLCYGVVLTDGLNQRAVRRASGRA